MFTKIDKNLDKIEQVKSLAGSIAHETRNPLAGIKGCDVVTFFRTVF